MDINKKILYIVSAIILAVLAISMLPAGLVSAEAVFDPSVETAKFSKHLDIWFMSFLIAIIMMFIKKFEWGVALAVLLSAAASYITYLFILALGVDIPGWGAFDFSTVWTFDNIIRASVCAITVIVTIGVFIGTVKSWQYILVGVLFAPVYLAVEYMCGYFGGIMSANGNGVMDPGGAILVHMCAAYFGIGVILALREKRAFDEPMYSTTHSMTFAWLAALLLFMLWPSFVTAFLPAEAVAGATAVCYMAGMGSIISAFVAGKLLSKKLNAGIYAFAILGGMVSMSPVMLIIDPFEAVLVGMAAGVLSTLCFMYLQPWLCSKMGVLDVMGVHNLHGMCGWLGVILLFILSKEIAVLEYAFGMVAVTLASGLVVGFILKLTRGKMDVIMDDRNDFIFNEDPACPEHVDCDKF